MADYNEMLCEILKSLGEYGVTVRSYDYVMAENAIIIEGQYHKFKYSVSDGSLMAKDRKHLVEIATQENIDKYYAHLQQFQQDMKAEWKEIRIVETNYDTMTVIYTLRGVTYYYDLDSGCVVDESVEDRGYCNIL